MPGALSLTIGTATVSFPLKLTNANLRAAIRRYAITKGIGVDSMTEAQIGEAVLRELARIVRDGSLDQHRAELLAAQQAAMEAVLSAENDLYDEPVPPPGG